jgi:hypothetical protein
MSVDFANAFVVSANSANAVVEERDRCIRLKRQQVQIPGVMFFDLRTVPVQAGWPPHESSGRLPPSAISPRARPTSVPVWSDVAVPAVFRQSAPEFPVSMNDSGRIAAQYAEAIRLCARVPTLTLSGSRCNRSGFCLQLQHSRCSRSSDCVASTG